MPSPKEPAFVVLPYNATPEEIAFAADLARTLNSAEDEPCSRCGQSYPAPVCLHHDEAECEANRKTA